MFLQCSHDLHMSFETPRFGDNDSVNYDLNNFIFTHTLQGRLPAIIRAKNMWGPPAMSRTFQSGNAFLWWLKMHGQIIMPGYGPL